MSALHETICSHFASLESFQLAFIGVLISVLSIVFAVIIGKRDEKRTIEKLLNDFSSTDVRERNKKIAWENRKDILDKTKDELLYFCKRIVSIIIILLVLYLLSNAIKYVSCTKIEQLALLVDLGLSLLALIWFIMIGKNVWKEIKEE